MKKISIEVLDQADLGRGFSGADWWWEENGDLTIRISKLRDWRWEMCLAVHELCEALLCKHNGVSQEAVDAFDAEYEATHSSDLNAGDDKDAPYKKEHSLATAIERILAAEFGICWADYDRELAAIPPNSKALQKLRKVGLLK